MSVAHGMFTKESWLLVESFANWREQMMREDGEFYKTPYNEQIKMWEQEVRRTTEGGA